MHTIAMKMEMELFVGIFGQPKRMGYIRFGFIFVFSWRGAEKGFDRFYAWPDILTHPKKKNLILFSICLKFLIC
ncbi:MULTISPECIES: hypothetical protein [unclassified Bacillus (in: firmicutes)]|uniref:hypothetical protein n=1 Tax=Bacillus TaxID=1386 RepID=UPI00157214C6|nr:MULTISPECIES: hypothetical protein [unclassified Bacillus (in: firmicutes)]MBC6975564.1 hypothetical protein [Bacillus sp. Xin]NSW35433.1 hypothetical protein [Bacillus sp. Xin1]